MQYIDLYRQSIKYKEIFGPTKLPNFSGLTSPEKYFQKMNTAIINGLQTGNPMPYPQLLTTP
jgi:hypothetical protein